MDEKMKEPKSRQNILCTNDLFSYLFVDVLFYSGCILSWMLSCWRRVFVPVRCFVCALQPSIQGTFSKSLKSARSLSHTHTLICDTQRDQKHKYMHVFEWNVYREFCDFGFRLKSHFRFSCGVREPGNTHRMQPKRNVQIFVHHKPFTNGSMMLLLSFQCIVPHYSYVQRPDDDDDALTCE